MRQYHSETCQVLCEDNGKTVTADILDFKSYRTISVSINKSVKLNLNWNGKIYEGKMGGMSFVTDGPEIINVTQGRS